ncbi:FkbM family methyltransferase [Pedobacter sp. MW01-1-1]|uniref:FkbM family methyltransferase n=1 Tax=Pedobacter sp. MW01-1-1 TaxID=3383027 RepID=UPI003FEDE875
MNISYYSQNGQDFIIDQEIFDKQRDGYFVEIGAHDGIKYSNTYFFEKERGWKGICIEANPKIYPSLVKNRNCYTLNTCISTTAKIEDFLCLPGKLEMLSGLTSQFSKSHLSRIEREMLKHNETSENLSIECLTFGEVIERFKVQHIDYLSIDTEGSELSILKSIDFNKISISVISAENTYKNSENSEYLKLHGYKKIARVGEDDIFMLSEEME